VCVCVCGCVCVAADLGDDGSDNLPWQREGFWEGRSTYLMFSGLWKQCAQLLDAWEGLGEGLGSNSLSPAKPWVWERDGHQQLGILRSTCMAEAQC
jgi:hypothetical protein